MARKKATTHHSTPTNMRRPMILPIMPRMKSIIKN